MKTAPNRGRLVFEREPMTVEKTGANHGRRLFDKLWDDHVVVAEPDAPAILYVDLHLIHEVTSPQAFSGLEARGLSVRRPELTIATMDHSTPTDGLVIHDPVARKQIETLERNCEGHGIELFRLGSERHGIVHVIGPELGLTRPGMTIVCGDSHTATHGAFGALAFGIGTSEVEHVLATQSLLQRKPETTEVRIEGKLGSGVTAKDVVLALISSIGTGGGTGQVFEYRGGTVRAMSMDERMTLCNMTIEAGARAGMVAPDDTTFEYLAGREFAPSGAAWENAVNSWKKLVTDDGAVFDRSVTLDVSELEPMMTFGTNPGMALPVGGRVPEPADVADPGDREALAKALAYMGIEPGAPLAGQPIDAVFVGSCTNSRISDIRQAAAVLEGRKVADGVRMLVVPGSEGVRRQAEAEGLDRVFADSGAEWRLPGCSMCIAMNGDQLQPVQRAVSTSNRNFEGRQGPGGRTFLASPLTAAASAVTGTITDARTLEAVTTGAGRA
jgi:3-isopropylmalate/(R)-2-methylmalate dehydratase large subunit